MQTPGSVNGFPQDFLWGVSTSACQIEGSPSKAGGGLHIWESFAKLEGKVDGRDTPDVACDHYNRWKTDLEIMKEIGVNAYRFSVSWARLFRDGTSLPNQAGMDFYKRLVDALLNLGITPCLTLYHWDLPSALEDRGGWLNPDSAKWFGDFSGKVATALGDKVKMWITLNEPWVIADQGYLRGVHAPGKKSFMEARKCANNLLRAHGQATAALRAAKAQNIGIAVNLTPQYPASDRMDDLDAAKKADAYVNRQYLDPILLGKHPDEMRELYGTAWEPISDADLKIVNQPIDFIGVNYYLKETVCSDINNPPLCYKVVKDNAAKQTEMGWEIYPAGLGETLETLEKRYGKINLYITENGAAYRDSVTLEDGMINDTDRIEYIKSHLEEAARAIKKGINLKGYFLWTLLDNFEWQFGYQKKFGIVHVDFATQERRLKKSAEWYREQIKAASA